MPIGSRSRPFERALRLAGPLALALLLAAAPARADLWYESYEKADRALRAGEWDEAVRQIHLALEGKGDSSARARTYGMNFTSYFPYYKLAVAYYNLGDLDAASQALENEERASAVQQSAADYAELQSLRQRVQQEREAREQQRIDQIVSESLGEAGRLERAGQLDDALRAVERARAVAPDDPRTEEMRNRLLRRIAEQQQAAMESQRQADQDRRIAGLLERGRAELAAGDLEAAASTFDQALTLRDDPATQALLDEVRGRMRERIEAEQDAQRIRDTIAGGLERAAALEQSGSYAEALDALQAVLALDPGNARALALQDRLRGAQLQREQEGARGRTVAGLIKQAEDQFAAEDYEQALSTANRALALEPGNREVWGFIARAQAQLQRQLLAAGRQVNFPPVITFSDHRPSIEAEATETAVQRVRSGFRTYELPAALVFETVRSPAFNWSGAVWDSAEPTVEIGCRHLGGSVDAQAVEILESGETATEANCSVGSRTDMLRIGEMAFAQFAVEQHLEPGLTLFRVVARDPEGMIARSEYLVFYSQPLYRSSWLYVALGGLFVAGVGVQVVRRARRRTELLRRRFNPYVAGAPVLEDGSFFGREQLMGRVLQTIHNNSLLLYGERRIGKTSFQHRLKRRLSELEDPEFKFYPVYIDLQGTPQERFFPTMQEEIFHELEPLLDGLQPTPSEADAADYGYRAFVRNVQHVLRKLKTKTDKKVKLVLLIDEVDELNAYDPRINQRLRSLFMKSFAENLVSVVSGVGIKKHWESEGSPWYNFFEEVEVKPFRRQDAEALIKEPIRGIFRLDSGVVARIIDSTDCKPYLIQKLCVSLVNRLHEQGRRRITLADVEAVASTQGEQS